MYSFLLSWRVQIDIYIDCFILCLSLTICKITFTIFVLKEEGIAAGMKSICCIKWGINMTKFTILHLTCCYVSTQWEQNILCTGGMCNTTYRMSDIMNNQSFMSLYIYQMFSPLHWHRDYLGCETS